jgi:hypothetical protein
MKRLLSIGAGAVALALALPTTAGAAIFNEIGDAGQSLVTANLVTVADPTRIDGRIGDATDADLFALSLTAGVAFTATTSPETSDGIFDTQLFLFDAAGNGIRYNDDIDVTDFFSTLSFAPTVSGVYYLGISGVGLNPKNATGDFIYVRDPFDATAQPGPSSGGPLASWGTDGSGLSDFGSYRIQLTGAAPVPEPESAVMLAVGLLGLLVSRRLKARV